jgi:glutathione S-transferase
MSLRLFYSPGACSIVPHIALAEAGAQFELVKVMLAEGQHLQPEYLAINPHARVPALGTARGVITENVAILNFIADEYGAAGSVPRGDHRVTAQCNQLLGWFASTVHISFAQVWRATRFTDDERAHPAIIEGGRNNLEQQFAEIEQLSDEGWLAGDEFNAADSYALIFFRWGKRIGMDMVRFPRWAALNERILAREAVQATLQREGWTAGDFRAG